MVYNVPMEDTSFFTSPQYLWQRRYEALRAYYVEGLSDEQIAVKFGYAPGSVTQLRHQFRNGALDFSLPGDGSGRRSITPETRQLIISWRKQEHSAQDIVTLLGQAGVKVSVRTVERVLAEEGFSKLKRRAQRQKDTTILGAVIAQRAEKLEPAALLQNARFVSPGAGVFLFAPLIAQIGLQELVRSAGLPETKLIGAYNYVLSSLALKLMGTERYAHVGDHAFDTGMGLFAGLTSIPKCTALSTYSYSLDQEHIQSLQEVFVSRISQLGWYAGGVINLDFHTAPHYGDESVLDTHWAGARGKRMKGALTLFAQDAASKLLVYSAADIQRQEADDQVLEFLSFWRRIRSGESATFVFDSKLTTYKNLKKLNDQGVKFITLRRRGSKLVKAAEQLEGWKRITIKNAKRKHPNPQVHDSLVELRDYGGELRQLIIRENGREKPTFLVTNDLQSTATELVSTYARRWRVENGIAEAVKFFHLNALSSPILIKVHFDLLLTLIADTLYWQLAQQLRGFEHCDAPKLYRHFVKGSGIVELKDKELTLTYNKRAHNPILRAVPWEQFPQTLPWLDGIKLNLKFK